MPRIATTRGFGLIEVMVGLVIGMIATIVMFQTFAVSERQKRTTTGAADAQTSGAIGTFMMERDIKMAGWGVDMSEMPNCSAGFYSWHASSTPPGISQFAPVLITDGGTGPDSVTINYFGNPADANIKFVKTIISKTMPTASSEYEVNSTYGCKEGDLVLVSQAGKGCTLSQITQVQSSTGTQKLQHNRGDSAPYNPAADDMSGWPKYTEETVPAKYASVQCFSRLFSKTYQITSHQLTLTQPNSTGVTETLEATPEILDLQARYGVAAAGSQTINEWVEATGVWSPGSLTTDHVRRIKAVQIAILARSATYDKPEDGSTCTATTTDNVNSWPAWAGFKTANLPSDWACYRYKVFEIKIPLRNVIWAKT